jgi:hypothetical protein
MSNVIDFLEKLGQDSRLRHATSTEVDQALLRAGIDPAVRAAISGSDRRMLEALVGATHNIFCGINVPEEPEEEDEEEREQEGEGEEGDEEDGGAEANSRGGAVTNVA